MKFNETWLREWVNPVVSSDILCQQIINSGIEIELLNVFNPLCTGVIVGEIIDCIKHKKHKQCKIVKVNIGKEKLLNIVCRASNCRSGIKVVVATIGAVLPNKVVIDTRIVQGEISEGMLCSFAEIGLFESNDIIEVDVKEPIGKNISEIFLLKDKIFKVTTTPNRPDGLSILGLARNIAATNNLVLPILSYKKNDIKINRKIFIDIHSNKECTYFAGRLINNIQVNVNTPLWMKKKLFFCDMLSNDVITNITNYVLMEIGQPLHILDADQINDAIIVRMARENEKIILKNNNIVYLDKKILVISDNQKILSIPGNINSDIVDIKNSTKSVFLGNALLNKRSILSIMKKFPSNKILEYYRYGIDEKLQNYAIEYATDLILKICGGVSGAITKKTSCFKIDIHKNILLHHNNINKVIGVFIDVNTISHILKRLDYTFIFKREYWDVIPPSWRFDIIIEEDVIGDILRIYGYENIFPVSLKKIFIVHKKYKLKDFLLDKAKILLTNKGYFETITYSFIDPKRHNIFFPHQSKLLISNPISKDMSCMRTSLWPGLLQAVSYNKNRQNHSIKFFESGLCFLPDKDAMLGVKQEFFLGGIISGTYMLENWHSLIRKVDFYDLKGDLECLLESICGLNNIEFRKKPILGLHPKQSAAIYLNNHYIGKIGAIHPRLEELFNFHDNIFVFEILFNKITNFPPVKIKKISKFPSSRRDISFLISKDIEMINVIEECKNFFKKGIVEINLFDIYFCKKISMTQKSVGISFVFQSDNKTLHENMINIMLESCIISLNKKFQIILRK
ncbi:phenylalanine--tRNA ligase subunit beta [Buchnera aphidicola]|uniref:phenylalanine--tRNA ligase subunit beta n=1 Tax=Buchnera aphidicola TaxID=9 RepID=UPI003464B62F